MKKILTFIFTCFCLSSICFADLGSTLKEIGTSIEAEISKGASKVRLKLSEKLIGTWTFSNSSTSTTFVFNNDETMTITQKTLLRSRSWEGSFNALGSSISFKISGGDNDGETWSLKYSIEEDSNKMTITSDDLPDDYNKYDFSKSTIFTKK